ncbi:MAG: AbrB/MazE/SpoVT family DNA-binding domain-containing protein, partial [Candidatus Binataceae bacterium]
MTVRVIGSGRLTSKGQVTVPAAVRKKLNLKPGDTVVFEARESGGSSELISLRKAEPLDVEFLSALEDTLS